MYRKEKTDRQSNWGQHQRLEFIEFRLFWEGRLNRSDLIDFFGISRPQASLDLARYIEIAPQNITYDRTQKKYQATRGFTPVIAQADAAVYLDLLLASRRPQANFLGSAPSVGVVKFPSRRVETSILRHLLIAMREHLILHIDYQSMNRTNPTTREISPHAIAFDGLRWHVRAYCHEQEAFRDFVFARILKVHKSLPSPVDGQRDTAWNQVLSLELAPHPGLSPAQKRAVALDYGMKKGRTVLRTRRALLSYVLRQLGLEDRERPAKVQHIVLINRKEIEASINDQDETQ